MQSILVCSKLGTYKRYLSQLYHRAFHALGYQLKRPLARDTNTKNLGKAASSRLHSEGSREQPLFAIEQTVGQRGDYGAVCGQLHFPPPG